MNVVLCLLGFLPIRLPLSNQPIILKKHNLCFNVCHYVTDHVFGILNKSDTNMCVGLVITLK